MSTTQIIRVRTRSLRLSPEINWFQRKQSGAFWRKTYSIGALWSFHALTVSLHGGVTRWISQPLDPYTLSTIGSNRLSGNGWRHPVRRTAPQPEQRIFAANAGRHDLRGERDQGSADKAEPPINQRRGRANSSHCLHTNGRRAAEPHDQGG